MRWIAVVRRGPAEVKFDKKEMEYVIANLSPLALDAEIDRVTAIMESIGQDPAAARANILEALPKALPTNSASRFRFEFLASSTRILGNEQKYVTGLEVEDNTLVPVDGDTKARGTGHKRVIDVDTVIFAIGDKVDTTFGLPTAATSSPRIRSPASPWMATPMKRTTRRRALSSRTSLLPGGHGRPAPGWWAWPARTGPTAPRPS
jgi:ferredoxin--NADP+ reductase